MNLKSFQILAMSKCSMYEIVQAKGAFEWAPPADFRIIFDNLKSELFIGGVYVRLFLKNPSFPLRAPKGFLEGLLKTYLADIAEGSAASQERVIVLSAAAAELLRHHQGLADHAVTLGYVTRLLKLLSNRLEKGEVQVRQCLVKPSLVFTHQI